MLSKIKSAAILGLDCKEIEVEVDLSNGLPCFNIVGLPDKAVEEAKERVKSAIKNSGAAFPQKRITVNLAPANIRKEGPSFDLPIALGILAASEQITLGKIKFLVVGELSLSGDLRSVNGVLPLSMSAEKYQYERIIVPIQNAREAAVVKGIEVIPAHSLKEIIYFLRGEKKIKPMPPTKIVFEHNDSSEYDMSHIKGQEHAKRALEIAAAGGHNILMSGPPGSGKSLLAKTLTTILPALSFEESLEISKIYSVAGLLSHNEALLTKRPFRNPHHSASNISLVGGGQWPKPGEISLAHRGVLFLDELPEFSRSTIEMLRQPLEDGKITISRANGTLTFPARFVLISAQNPCPCGFLNDPVKNCICTPTQVLRYQKKISGPLLDRIDIHIEVPRLKQDKLMSEERSESSNQIRQRIEAVRKIQFNRFEGKNKFTNSEMNTQDIKSFCKLSRQSQELLKSAIEKFGLSARSYSKVLKISRTIADIEKSENIKANHVAEALQYRARI